MIKMTIQSNTERKNLIVDENNTVEEVLGQAGISAAGCAINLCGYMVTDATKTLKELSAPETAWISLVRAEKNA